MHTPQSIAEPLPKVTAKTQSQPPVNGSFFEDFIGILVCCFAFGLSVSSCLQVGITDNRPKDRHSISLSPP